MLRRRWKIIFLIGVVFALFAAFVTVLFPLEYRADAQVLIISSSRYGVDPYTVVKSAERVGENIAQIMKTSDFYNKVKEQQGTQVDWNYFESLAERKKRKAWDRAVSPSVIFGTGVLSVSTFHQDPVQAERLARAIVSTLERRAVEYVGGDVTLKIVNQPIVTNWPVRPNLVINTFLGFIIGIFLMGFLTVRKK
jgi:capsular polysaccharide biosynthesis protein